MALPTPISLVTRILGSQVGREVAGVVVSALVLFGVVYAYKKACTGRRCGTPRCHGQPSRSSLSVMERGTNNPGALAVGYAACHYTGSDRIRKGGRNTVF